MNEGLGEPYEVPVPFFLITNPEGTFSLTAATPWRWPSPYHRSATRLRVAATPGEEPEVVVIPQLT
jgi:hypothetical protein